MKLYTFSGCPPKFTSKSGGWPEKAEERKGRAESTRIQGEIESVSDVIRIWKR